MLREAEDQSNGHQSLGAVAAANTGIPVMWSLYALLLRQSEQGNAVLR